MEDHVTMKIKNQPKKLSLNKKTISALNDNQMLDIKGGTLPTEDCKTYYCPTGILNCITPNTYEPYC